jgi:hypothetical protein
MRYACRLAAWPDTYRALAAAMAAPTLSPHRIGPPPLSAQAISTGSKDSRHGDGGASGGHKARIQQWPGRILRNRRVLIDYLNAFRK